MGNGPKHTADTAKPPPGTAAPVPLAIVDDDTTRVVDLVAGDLGLAQAPLDGPVHYCERERDLRFETLPDADLQVGQPLRLALDNPPLVANFEGMRVGTLDDPQEPAILECLVAGYAFSGHLTTLDDDRRGGVIRVSGRLQLERG